MTELSWQLLTVSEWQHVCVALFFRPHTRPFSVQVILAFKLCNTVLPTVQLHHTSPPSSGFYVSCRHNMSSLMTVNSCCSNFVTVRTALFSHSLSGLKPKSIRQKACLGFLSSRSQKKRYTSSSFLLRLARAAMASLRSICLSSFARCFTVQSGCLLVTPSSTAFRGLLLSFME